MSDDEWMNPRRSSAWSMTDVTKAREERPFVIQRCRRLVVTGNVSHVEEWGHWSSHATKAERDIELRQLRKEHSWKLRPASYVLGTLRVDVDEDSILAQAEVIKALRAAQQLR